MRKERAKNEVSSSWRTPHCSVSKFVAVKQCCIESGRETGCRWSETYHTIIDKCCPRLMSNKSISANEEKVAWNSGQCRNSTPRIPFRLSASRSCNNILNMRTRYKGQLFPIKNKLTSFYCRIEACSARCREGKPNKWLTFFSIRYSRLMRCIIICRRIKLPCQIISEENIEHPGRL